MGHWSDKLVELKACAEAVEWAKTKPDFATAWAKCKRPDWMLWLLDDLMCWPEGAQAEYVRATAAANAEYERALAEALRHLGPVVERALRGEGE